MQNCGWGKSDLLHGPVRLITPMWKPHPLYSAHDRITMCFWQEDALQKAPHFLLSTAIKWVEEWQCAYKRVSVKHSQKACNNDSTALCRTLECALPKLQSGNIISVWQSIMQSHWIWVASLYHSALALNDTRPLYLPVKRVGYFHAWLL